LRPVVIVGGGVAGCAAALALRHRGIDGILIAEAGNTDTFQIGETIPPDSRLLLERLRVWDGFAEEGHEPCLGSRSAWGADAVGYSDFLLNPHGTGWHLDRQRFGAFLAKQATEAGAELRRGAAVVSVERAAEDVLALLIETGGGIERVEAQFVIDATGARSRVAKSAGARPLTHDRLLWVGALFDGPAEPEASRLTMLEAVDVGWWYAARVPGGRVVVGIATDAETNRRAMLHRADRWLPHLETTRHMNGWLADCRWPRDPRMFIRSAPSFVLDRICGSHWLAVGDAASACDPLVSRGLHNALADGLQAAAAIADCLAGVRSALDDYQASIFARFDDYLETRDYFYDLEQRWPTSPFWRNRRTRPQRRT
jgi:flavin-dependent dehydrogenase